MTITSLHLHTINELFPVSHQITYDSTYYNEKILNEKHIDEPLEKLTLFFQPS